MPPPRKEERGGGGGGPRASVTCRWVHKASRRQGRRRLLAVRLACELGFGPPRPQCTISEVGRLQSPSPCLVTAERRDFSADFVEGDVEGAPRAQEGDSVAAQQPRQMVRRNIADARQVGDRVEELHL